MTRREYTTNYHYKDKTKNSPYLLDKITGQNWEEISYDYYTDSDLIKTIFSPEASLEYTYDELGRVLSEKETNLTGSNSNTKENSYSYDVNGRLMTAPKRNFHYNDTTGLLDTIQHTGFLFSTFHYDGLNRVDEINIKTPGNIKIKANYSYDAQGRLLEAKTLAGPDLTPITDFIYD